MIYANADTNVLLEIQHTLLQSEGGGKEKASITTFFSDKLSIQPNRKLLLFAANPNTKKVRHVN
jgi:hypothetical protein